MKKLSIIALLLALALAPLGAGVASAQSAAEVVGAAVGLMSWHDVVMGIFAEMGNVVLTIVSKVLDLAGAVLNFSIDLTVNMGEFLNKVKIVEVGWTVFRDLANLFFIFVLLWLGVRMILGLVGGEGKKTLLMVIIMALLINFSLFITKAVVDAGNIATLHFYNAMRPDLIDPATGQPLRDGSGQVVKAGLSDIYMEALKLQTVYDPSAIGTSDAVAAAGGFASQFIKVGLATLLGSVFFLVAAFVFFAAGIMFISRAVVLMFLMLLSPLAFVAQVLPNSQAQGLGKQWWDMLFKQTFWAPLYMALTYAVAKAIQSGGFRDLLNITGNEASFAALMSSPASDNVGIIVNYIILIVVMMATLIIASKWGAVGSSMVMEWSKKAQGWGMGVLKGGAYGATLGAAGGALSRALGAYGKSVEKRYEGSTSPLGRAALRYAERLQTGKFGGKASYKERQEKGTFFSVGEKEAEEAIKGMRGKPNEQAKYISALSSGLQKKMYEKLSARDRAAVETAKDTEGKVILPEATIKDLRERLSVEEREKTEKEIEKTTKESRGKATQDTLKDIAEAIQKALKAGVADPLSTGVDVQVEGKTQTYNEQKLKDLIQTVTEKDVVQYEPDTLKTLVGLLRPAHMEAIQKSNEIAPELKANLRDMRVLPLASAAGGGVQLNTISVAQSPINPQEVEKLVGKMTPKEVAKLDKILKGIPEIIKNFEVKDLAAMAEEGVDKTTAAEIKRIIANFNTNRQGLTQQQVASISNMETWFKTGPGKDLF